MSDILLRKYFCEKVGLEGLETDIMIQPCGVYSDSGETENLGEN